VRVRDTTTAQRALLAAVSNGISRRLEAAFTDPAEPDGPNAAIDLRERGRHMVMEIPETLVIEATSVVAARESFRVRVKGRRDRMLFREPPARLPKRIERAEEPGFFRRQGGPGRPPPRGRR
jgi:hypothetical protein